VKFFTDDEMAALRAEMDVKPGDLLMFAACGRVLADEILGGMRTHMANALGIERTGHDFLWVVDFPMFKYDEAEKRYAAEHHPFTMPREEDLDLIETDPLKVRSYTYDFVMDGFEAGGGGIRIHNADLQMRVLKRLGFTEERATEQFGYLIEALGYGAPTLGGFALGLDRVCMLLVGSDSIRDVMAFPKTSSGADLMSAAPSAVSQRQLDEVALRLTV
jgi:aspartyl-tRNA synthetase